MSDVLGIICARKDSQRLPDKNLQRINGLTLVENAAKILHEAGVQPVVIATDFELDFDPAVYSARHVLRSANISSDKVPLQETVKCSPFRFFRRQAPIRTPQRDPHFPRVYTQSPLQAIRTDREHSRR